MNSEKLTKDDVKKIQAEIDERKTVLRPKILEDVKTARAQGDLSENFEYYAAKRDKNRNESRIRYLERILNNAQVIEDTTAEDEVGLYTQVELFLEDTKEIMSIKLVTSIRGNSLEGRISIDSPIGKAILGHKVGERVYVKVSDDFGYYAQIKSITKLEDDGTDDIRSY